MENENQLYIEDFDSVISRSPNRQIKVVCPLCRDRRTNKADRALSINTSTLEYHCHYCDAKGVLKSRNESQNYNNDDRYYNPKKRYYKRPENKNVSTIEYSESFLEYFKGRGISEKTLKKVGITQEVEYFPQLQKKSGCIAFNYFLNGELVNTKFRTRNKDFKLVSGAELILYNIDSINPKKYKDGEEKYAIFVEGEADCITYIECGYSHVVSVPNGANKNLEYLDNYIDDFIEPLDIIYISSDNDNKGVELKNELLRRFGEDKCRIINYPEPCKDINEVLVKYGKDTVRKCFEGYTEIKPEGVKELVDVESSLDYLFNHGFEAGDKVGIPSLDEIISFKVGMLCIVTGIPGHGKTFMLNFLLGRLNILHDWKIAFFSPEFYPIQDHIGQMIETFGGKRFSSKNYNIQEYELMKDYVTRNLFWIDPDDTDINSVMERAKYLIKKKGIKALVIDPFNSLTDNTRKNVKQDEYISDFLQKIRWFARRYGVAVFLVMHPTKKQKLENGLYPVCDLYDCKGASEVNDKADIGITAWRNQEEDYNEIHITKIKHRHLGKLDYATFKFNINNGRYTPIEKVEILKKQGIDTKTMQVDWDNSNWIIDKLKGRQVSEPIVFPQPNEDFLTESSTDCPF